MTRASILASAMVGFAVFVAPAHGAPMDVKIGEIVVRDLACDARGTVSLPQMAVGVGLAEQAAGIRDCASEPAAARVAWTKTTAGVRTEVVDTSGGRTLERCLEAALAPGVPLSIGHCTGVLLLGDIDEAGRRAEGLEAWQGPTPATAAPSTPPPAVTGFMPSCTIRDTLDEGPRRTVEAVLAAAKTED